MHWVAPSERDTASDTLEKRLWNAADQFRANSGLTAAQYSAPVLGLIFLLFAETRFAKRHAALLPSPSGRGAGGEGASRRATSRTDDPAAYLAEGVIFLPQAARFAHLLNLPEGANVGKVINDAMAEIEKHNPQLAGVLPRTYQIFTSTLLKELLKKVSEIPVSLDYDTFGRIYEYFLGEFARTEGQKGGEFYTPSSIVRLLVEVIEPFHGRILDPACGSGGMFVQSARFVAEHQKNAADELFIHGVEKTDDTGRLARMNLAIHGLEGDIRHGGHINSYYDDPHEAVGKFDFVLANPPFNVNAVDKDRLASDVGAGRRFPFGVPRTDNANMLWIQLFYSSLNDTGRAGFVMANSASDARSSEQEIRKQLIKARAVDVMVAVGPNLFYTVTLPCTLWFLDKGKSTLPSPSGRGAGGEGANRADTILFIDARHIYRQIDRAHRDWSDAQIGFIANIVRLYRNEAPDTTLGGQEAATKLTELFSSLSPGEGAGVRAHPQKHKNLPAEHITFARQLRQQHTDAESLIWYLLRDRRLAGFKFRRQHPYPPYVLDFYCHEAALCVELDGSQHAEQIAHDTKRDAALSIAGIRTLRFWNNQVLGETEAVLSEIWQALHDAPSPPTPLPEGEGLAYRDIPGLCKAATLAEIEAQGWSLNPGRYVGVAAGEEVSDEDFKEKLEELSEELEVLNAQARDLEQTIARNVAGLLA